MNEYLKMILSLVLFILLIFVVEQVVSLLIILKNRKFYEYKQSKKEHTITLPSSYI
jgi:hypothetical protein